MAPKFQYNLSFVIFFNIEVTFYVLEVLNISLHNTACYLFLFFKNNNNFLYCMYSRHFPFYICHISCVLQFHSSNKCILDTHEFFFTETNEME